MPEESRPDPNPDPDEGANEEILTTWRRVKAYGFANTADQSTKFVAILDMRAAIFTIKVTSGGVNPREIAYALVLEMAAHTAMPPGRSFVEREGQLPGEPSEWLVLNPVHASGLLHRIGEREFDARESAAVPPQFVGPLEEILFSIHRNVATLKHWHQEVFHYRKPPFGVFLDFSTWETHRAMFLDLADDPQFKVDVVRFFSYLDRYDSAMRVIMSSGQLLNPEHVEFNASHWADEAARAEVESSLDNQTTRLGERILKEHLSEERRHEFLKRAGDQPWLQ